jgi:hypothetical protein
MGMKLFRQNMPVSVASALHVCIILLVSVFWVKRERADMTESERRAAWAEFWAMIRNESKK